MQSATSPTGANGSRKERLVASKFFITLTTGQCVERTYTGRASQQFAAYVAEFPIGSGAHLRYTMSLEAVEPLVIFG
jgi:hypothetical protein